MKNLFLKTQLSTKILFLLALSCFLCDEDLSAQSVVKILFDAKKAESAGGADWVIDADQWNLLWNPNAIVAGSGNQSNAQRFPTPSQTLITASTPETFWTGAISNWAVDCAKRGYQVETLPHNGSITYGNSSNPQDLSNYKVYIIDEPNILFTSSEKSAIMQFVMNGGGLFLISDHTISDRNGDGQDSPVILNDFISNNGILNNGLGFKFDLANLSQTSNNVITDPSDSILHGPAGNVTQVMWANGTTISLTPSQNSTVKGVVYTIGTMPGNSNAMCVYCRAGSGKVAAIGDSSPTDDGTGDPNNTLYNGYTVDAGGNHKRLLMNITIWLANTIMAGVNEIPNEKEDFFTILPNPVSDKIQIKLKTEGQTVAFSIHDLRGKIILSDKIYSSSVIDLEFITEGIYFITLTDQNGNISTKKFCKTGSGF